MNIIEKITTDLGVKTQQVKATVELLNEGATVPFIARYRKEKTGGLDDTQLRSLEEKFQYYTDLNQRRETILDSIQKQDKLTPVLEKAIQAADNKARLEDLYLPYKPKRRTKAQIAREAGLEPLANAILQTQTVEVKSLAEDYIDADKNVADSAAALEGARHILMEQFSESADLLDALRDYVWQQAVLISKVAKDKEQEGTKFKDYFDYRESLAKIPSHRALALFRGQKETILRLTIEFLEPTQDQHCESLIAKMFDIQADACDWLQQTVQWTWKIKLKLKVDVDLLMRLREKAELTAIDVFKENLKNLLMAAPAGKKITLGLDPGFRTGVKTVVVDDTGKLLAHTVIFPHQPQNKWDQALLTLAKLCQQHQVNLVSIGNGTASRETERLVKELAKQHSQLKFTSVVVSEAGASVYSASALAAAEFPNLDVSYRGAISIARRLQDPLAELVKIDPKAIGVGQYQHDVNQTLLGKGLDNVMEDCVNAVGADVNTASVPLLKSIAGLNATIAENIVNYREANGRFTDRDMLKKVPRLGEKTYEQAVGFLRIIGGKNPLDASAVHPEAYSLVETIAKQQSLPVTQLIGNQKVIQTLKTNTFVTNEFGQATVKDIFAELAKPGRDPRPEFKMATFKEGVETLADLQPGLQLEGVVTNVTNFGAFVDIGVHQDGLVHISQLADKFVDDPNKVVKVGQIVQVKVLEVDQVRKRIQLTMKKECVAPLSGNTKKPTKKAKPVVKGSFGDLLSNAIK